VSTSTVAWQNTTMVSTKTAASLVAHLRSMASTRRRATQTTDAAALLAELLGDSRDIGIEERYGGISFRFALGGGERLTCFLHHRSTAPLTAAEAAVAERVCDGHTLAQIALLRGVSVNTVKSQLRQVFRKLEVDSRIALVRRLAP
jgi:DNA-binding CsgD family transcriptional regulator